MIHVILLSNNMAKVYNLTFSERARRINGRREYEKKQEVKIYVSKYDISKIHPLNENPLSDNVYVEMKNIKESMFFMNLPGGKFVIPPTEKNTLSFNNLIIEQRKKYNFENTSALILDIKNNNLDSDLFNTVMNYITSSFKYGSETVFSGLNEKIAIVVAFILTCEAGKFEHKLPFTINHNIDIRDNWMNIESEDGCFYKLLPTTATMKKVQVGSMRWTLFDELRFNDYVLL